MSKHIPNRGALCSICKTKVKESYYQIVKAVTRPKDKNMDKTVVGRLCEECLLKLNIPILSEAP